MSAWLWLHLFMKRPHSWGLMNSKNLRFNVGVGAGVEHSLGDLVKNEMDDKTHKLE